MKNKQINKFLFIFIVGLSLLFSFSSAADIFSEGQTLLTKKDYCGATKTTSTLPSYVEGASQAEQRKFIMSTLYNYFNNRTNVDYDLTDFNHLIDTSLNYYSDLYSKNYNGYYILADSIGNTAYSSTFKLYFYQKNDIDILYDKIKTVSGTYHQSVSFIDGSDFIFINVYSSGFSSNYYENCIGNCFFRLNQYYQKYSFSSNTSIKQSDTSVMDGSESNTYIFAWDGTTYCQYVADEPEVLIPEFATNLTDNEIASVVNNFINSIHWQNRNSAYNQFFIQHGETDGKYLLVLVSDYMYEFVSGLYIPAEISSVDYELMDYDTYSILFNNGVSGTFLPWQTDRFNYKLYTSLDGVNFDYFRDMDCKDFKEYRWNMDTPVIYSSFYFPFKTLLGNTVNDFDVTVNDYSEEVDLKFSELVNSETGENHVFEGLDVKSNEETNPIIAKLSQFFKEMLEGFSGLFQVLIDQIFNFSDFLLATYGENVVTLVFAILIKSVTVLVSSIALIFRAVGFILSLVAIPASSALFSVDVAVNSTGISFTGLNWGTKFVEGLNMLKTFSWNGLGLWTLFESFVSALEIILFVKIVRKHYSHTF